MGSFRILVTRELSPSSLSGADPADTEVIQVPFIEVRPIESAEKKAEIASLLDNREAIAVVFTSKHAVRFTMEQIPGHRVASSGWKIYCLDGITKEYVTYFVGSGLIIDTASNAAKLAERIIRHGDDKNIVFFCGDKRRDDLPQLLKAHGIGIREIQVYQTIQTPVKIQEHPDGIVFFSPSAVESFFSLNMIKADAVCFAIGTTTAEALRERVSNRIITSASPVEEELMQTVWRYIKQSTISNDQH